MENYIYVNKSVSNSLDPVFSQVYLFAKDHINYNTRFTSNGLLKIPTNNTSIYGRKSFATSTITSWNFFQSHFTGINLKEDSVNQSEYLIKNYFVNLHDN